MPGTFVIAPDSDPPEVVGWTSAAPEPGSRIEFPAPARAGVDEPPPWRVLVQDATEPMHRTFVTKTARLCNGFTGTVIVLEAGREGEAEHLPDWTPLVERPGRPRRVYATSLRGRTHLLQQIAMASIPEVARAIDGVRGCPIWWFPDGTGGIQVLPEPSDEYAVRWEPQRTIHLGDLGRPRDLVELLPAGVLDAEYARAIYDIQERYDITASPMMAARATHARARASAIDMLNFMPGPETIRTAQLQIELAEQALLRAQQEIQRGIYGLGATHVIVDDPLANPGNPLGQSLTMEDIRRAQEMVLWEQPPRIRQHRNPAIQPLRQQPGEWWTVHGVDERDQRVVERVREERAFREYYQRNPAVWAAYALGTAITREALDDNLYQQTFGEAARAQMRYQGLAALVSGRIWGPRLDPETAARSRERARGLLKSLLRPEQWQVFEKYGVVRETIEGATFTLRPGAMIEAERPWRRWPNTHERWCVAPDPYSDGNDWMPEEDKLIGQLLHLRAGPDKLRAKANIFR